MDIPDDLRYSTDHEWARVEEGRVRIGITDYAQDALGDVVFVEVPEVGAKVERGASFSEVESTKSVSEIYAPVAGHDRRGQRRAGRQPRAAQRRPVRRGVDLRHRARRSHAARRAARRRGLPCADRGVRSVADDVFCNQCGHRNPAGANFCSSCGAPLAPRPRGPDDGRRSCPRRRRADDDMAVELGELPAGVGLLVVKRGPNVGSRFALDADIVRAGRHPESDIFLDDITVSRRHAEIVREGGRLRRARRRLAQRHLPQPRAGRVRAAVRRRRAADRHVQARVPHREGRCTVTRAPSDRSHLSIGEVLSLLQDEFPDVTISKIRFLESQGLLDPERTPSGYRKFYEADIDRLRWILRQQKDHYLPLKVIKDRLDDAVPPAGARWRRGRRTTGWRSRRCSGATGSATGPIGGHRRGSRRTSGDRPIGRRLVATWRRPDAAPVAAGGPSPRSLRRRPGANDRSRPRRAARPRPPSASEPAAAAHRGSRTGAAGIAAAPAR